ncbi:hypothetical protein K7432_014752, partial [Basidiobolus ranarum]
MDSPIIPKHSKDITEGPLANVASTSLSSSPVLAGKFNTFKSKPSVHLSVDNNLPLRPTSPSTSSNLSSYSAISKLSGDILLDAASFRSRESEDTEYMLRGGPTSPKRRSGLGIEMAKEL